VDTFIEYSAKGGEEETTAAERRWEAERDEALSKTLETRWRHGELDVENASQVVLTQCPCEVSLDIRLATLSFTPTGSEDCGTV
jgi:hypothetical protein